MSGQNPDTAGDTFVLREDGNSPNGDRDGATLASHRSLNLMFEGADQNSNFRYFTIWEDGNSVGDSSARKAFEIEDDGPITVHNRNFDLNQNNVTDVHKIQAGPTDDGGNDFSITREAVSENIDGTEIAAERSLNLFFDSQNKNSNFREFTIWEDGNSIADSTKEKAFSIVDDEDVQVHNRNLTLNDNNLKSVNHTSYSNGTSGQKTCDSNTEGDITYNGTHHVGCDGSSWHIMYR